jgi:hypothetical protein
MSAGGRITLGVACSLIAIGFAVLGAASGDAFPKGPWPFYGLAAFCTSIALACLVPGCCPIVLRVIGAVVFVVFALILYSSFGEPNFRRTLTGFCVIGLPAGYVAVMGTYPRWSRFAAAFGSS